MCFFLIADKLCNIPYICSMVFASLPFDWLAVSSLARSEGLFMFLALLSIYFFLREKYWLSAVVLGFAIITRITGILILPIYFTYLIYLNRTKVIRQIAVYLISLIPLLLYSLYLYNQFGSPFAYIDAGNRVYGNLIFNLPFISIIHGLYNPNISILKKIQVVALLAIYVYAWWVSFRRNGNKLMKIPFIWISIFIIQSLTMGGNTTAWGFHVFARFMIPAAPAAILVLMEKIPEKFWGFVFWAGTVLSIIYVVFYIHIMVKIPTLVY